MHPSLISSLPVACALASSVCAATPQNVAPQSDAFPAAPPAPTVVQTSRWVSQEKCDSQFLQKLPEVLFLARCPSIGDWQRETKKLSLTKLFEDEDVKAMMPGTMDSWDAFIAGLMVGLQGRAPDLPEEILNDFRELCKTGITGELAMAMSSPHVVDVVTDHSTLHPRQPDMYATVSLAGGREKIDRLLASLASWVDLKRGPMSARRVAEDSSVFYEFVNRRDAADPATVPGLRVGTRGSTVYLGAPSRESIQRLMGPPIEGSAAQNPNLIEADRLFTQRAGSMYFYLDGAAMLDSMGANRAELMPLGLDELRWAGMSFEPDGEYMRHRIEVRTDASKGIPTLFSEKQQFDLANLLPEKTVFGIQMAADGASASAALRNLMMRYAGKGERSWPVRQRRMREELGTDFDELLRLLGNEMAFAVVMPENGIIPDVYMIVRGRNNEAATRLAWLMESAVQRVDREVIVKSLEYQKKRIAYSEVKGMPLSPSMVVDGDLVVVGSTVLAAKKWLQFRSGGMPSLAASKRFQESYSALGGGPATGYIWVDWEAATRFLYGNFAQVAPMLAGAMSEEFGNSEEDENPSQSTPASRKGNESPSGAEQGLQGQPRVKISRKGNIDLSKLPSVDAVAPYMKPQLIRLRINNQGLSMESRASF
jgi:hypothetical protein